MIDPPVATTTDSVEAHPRPVGHRWIDLILAVTALALSSISLYVAVDHGRIERQMVEANSWPFLQLSATFSIHHDTTLTLVNAGVGPAKVDSIELFYQGRPVADLDRLLELCCGLANTPEARRAQIPQGLDINDPSKSVVRAGEARPLIRIPANQDDPALSQAFRRAARAITWRVCYCSVFDTCWRTDLVQLRPAPIARCPADVASFNAAVE